MEVEQRPSDIQMQIDEFYVLLDNEDFDTADRKLKKLSQIMGENDSEIVRAKTILELERS